MKKFILSLILGLCTLGAQAQVFEIAMPGDGNVAMPGDRNVAASDAMNLSPGMAERMWW
jgi:hypothetical protein